jgi:hypothetical protein
LEVEKEHSKMTEQDVQHVRLCDELCEAMGGQKFCCIDDLDRAILLAYVQAKGAVIPVEGLVKVTVQPESGENFIITLDRDQAQIRELKYEIEKVKGIKRIFQELSLVDKVSEDPHTSDVPATGSLTDDFILKDSSTVRLHNKSSAQGIRKLQLKGENESSDVIFFFKSLLPLVPSRMYQKGWTWDSCSKLLQVSKSVLASALFAQRVRSMFYVIPTSNCAALSCIAPRSSTLRFCSLHHC